MTSAKFSNNSGGAQGSGQIFTVVLILFFFVTGFSIFGMAIFSHSSRRRCVTLDIPVFYV